MNTGVVVSMAVVLAGMVAGAGGYLVGKDTGYDQCLVVATQPVNVNVRCPSCGFSFSIKVERK